MPLPETLLRRIQHVFYKYPIPPRRVIHQHMGHRPYQFPILYNGRAGHG